jgi:polyhydroxyalkanoate synthesis regulator phasin
MEVLIVLIAVIGLSSITDKILRHRREMAKIRGQIAPPPLAGDSDLSRRLEGLKQDSTDFALSIEHNVTILRQRVETLERRVQELEQQQQVTRP